MITMPTATIRVIRGVLEETELAALVTVLHTLSPPGSAPTPCLTTPCLTTPCLTTPCRASWTRPRRRSGSAWVAAPGH